MTAIVHDFPLGSVCPSFTVDMADAPRLIELAGGSTAIVDAADYDLLLCFSWCVSSEGYARRGKGTYMHRQIMHPPKGMQVDHINGDKLDNRRSNLRICTNAQNIAASRKGWTNARTGYRGVWPHSDGARSGFVAMIKANGKRHYLGLFRTAEEAAHARDAAAIRLHGEFARLNFPPVGAA